MSSTPPIARLSTSLVLGRGVPDVLADQVVAGHADQLPLAQVPELAEHLAHVRGHRRLARPRAAGEAHVQAGPRRGQPVPLPEPVDQQQRRDLADPGLDRGQPDELPVELVSIADSRWACSSSLSSTVVLG